MLMTGPKPRRVRLLGAALAWVAVIGLTWGVVGLPENCPQISPREARAAATATVDWFERNQLPDGRWVYRYNIDTGEVDRSPHVVRHSGVTMSLYQAHQAGIGNALEIADNGTEWSLDNLHEHGDLAMVSQGRYAPSGGTALLVAGLAIRRLGTNDPRYDSEMFAMGNFLVEMTEPTGAVLASWDTHDDEPVPDQYSLFFTGEAYFALALLSELDPEGRYGDWPDATERIGNYLATERDEAEDLFPPTSDHWAAYGLAASASAGMSLDADQADYAERLAQIFSIQIRYESQRTGEGLNWLLRGPIALGAGVGTLGEGLGALWTLTDEGEVLEDQRDAVGERLRCVAGVLYERQVDPAEAAGTQDPDLTLGAWFRLGWTQKDDQQHALSALLLAMPALEEEGERFGSAGDDSVARVLWLMVISVALVNPFRLRRLLAPTEDNEEVDGDTSQAPGAESRPPLTTRLAVAGGGTFLGLAFLALVADSVFSAIDISPPTATIAAGLVVGLTAIVDFLRPSSDPLPAESGRTALFVPLLVPGLLRPAGAVLAMAVAADVGLGAGLAVAAATAACALVLLRPASHRESTAEAAGWRALATIAVVGGIALMLNGIFAI